MFSLNRTKLVSLLVFAFVSFFMYKNAAIQSIAYRHDTRSDVFVQQWTADSTSWANPSWGKDTMMVR